MLEKPFYYLLRGSVVVVKKSLQNLDGFTYFQPPLVKKKSGFWYAVYMCMYVDMDVCLNGWTNFIQIQYSRFDHPWSVLNIPAPKNGCP
jgi:hypothetical protein